MTGKIEDNGGMNIYAVYCSELASELEEMAHRITVEANLPDCKRTQEMAYDTSTLFRAAYVLRHVVRGRWIGIDDEPHETWECDHCGKIVEHEQCSLPNFCDECGADMREVQEG